MSGDTSWTEMTCTNCHQAAGPAPSFAGVDIQTVIDICGTWKCSQCMNDQDAKAITAKQAGVEK